MSANAAIVATKALQQCNSQVVLLVKGGFWPCGGAVALPAELRHRLHLDHPDGELPDDHGLRRELVRLIRRVQPDAVCCPDPTAVFFGGSYFNNLLIGWTEFEVVDDRLAVRITDQA